MFLTHALSEILKVSKKVTGSAAAHGLLIPIWVSKWCGRIEVRGTIPSQRPAANEGILLIANHPSLVETIALPALLSPWRWDIADTKLPYSVADSRLFGRHSEWLYEHFRCIAVHRHELSSAGKSLKTARTCMQILTKHGLLIVYPEGGRTSKGDQWHQHGPRKVRSCNPTLVKMAQRTNATIIPVWISHGDSTKPQSLLRGYCKLFFQEKMVVTFGSPVTFSSPEVTDLEVATALLQAAPPDRN
jgi:1-acyl-sn-glycerol-3-phosphate acyltransferase